VSLDSLWETLSAQLIPTFADYRSRIEDVPVQVKSDRTLLTEADVAVEELIISAIRAGDPGAVIIAEEDNRTGLRNEIDESRGRVWVIDPIDGTSQFVQSEKTEFCSVVCLLEDWQPVEAFIIAPELGTKRTAIVVTANAGTKQVLVGGAEITTHAAADTIWLSLTGLEDHPSLPIEASAEKEGYRTKTHTTSQTLDMLRTALAIGQLTEPPLPQFSLFWRREQKLWDGAAGLCLAAATGLTACDEQGNLHDFRPEFLRQQVPTFPSTIVGEPQIVAWFIDTLSNEQDGHSAS